MQLDIDREPICSYQKQLDSAKESGKDSDPAWPLNKGQLV